MNSLAAKLIVRLMAIQLGVHAVTIGLVIAFAPRLLLLEPPVLDDSVATVGVWAGVQAVASTLATILLARRVRPALSSLATGSSSVTAPEVLAIYDLPARLVAVHVVVTLLLSGLVLLPPLRPPVSDLYTQVAMSLLALTMSSAAMLPLYVMLRGSVTRVLEIVPFGVAREACSLVEELPARRSRVRGRLLAAVTAPVAFVALGALLLVYAHARAQMATARFEEGVMLARASLGVPAGGDDRGRKEAIDAAAAHGFKMSIDPQVTAVTTTRGAAGEVRVSVPLDRPEDGGAVVTFDSAQLPAVTLTYALLALVATALAGILGARLGGLFNRDVAFAIREVRTTGAADVVRGTRTLGRARFGSVDALVQAIGDLGGVFREFAGAQQSAIVSKEATERMRGLFLASMSHDLRGPLNAILGFAELVRRSPLSDAQYESLQIVEQRGRELLVLIQTILDSARVEAGELDVAPDLASIGDVVMSAVLDARDLVPPEGVQVTGEVQPGLPRLLVDGTRIAQAITNVIMSSVRFTQEGQAGVIAVRARLPAHGDRLCVEVESAGGGLPPEEREKVFEAFKNVELARRHGSLGLGLSLAKSIVEIHGGTIDVEIVEGGGTLFRVWLPMHNDPTSIRVRATSRPTLA